MKTIKYLFAGLCSAFLLTGCLDEYKDLNTNPEQMGTVDPRNEFTGATLNFDNSSRAHLTNLYGGTMIYMQYLVGNGGASAGSYVSPTRPNEHPQPGNLAYSYYYNSFGRNLDYLINTSIPKSSEAERYADVKAIAQILLSYQQWRVLDTYGAAPITEAFRAQSEGIRTPRYDLYQKSIDENGTPMYKKIDADVKAAVATLKASDSNQYGLGNNDFFYFGDVQKWIKFGNTLRVKMAQRLEVADKPFYESVVNEVLTSASNIIASNDESCIYYHPNDYNNNNDDIQTITSNYVAAAAFVNYLKAYNDPRLPIMVRRNGFGDGNNNAENDKWFETFEKEYPNYADAKAHPEWQPFLDRYVGMPANPAKNVDKYTNDRYLTVQYHKEDKTEANMTIRMYSQVESRYFVKNGGTNGNNNMPARDIEDKTFEKNQDLIDIFNPIITYPETCFMLAEIAIKGNKSVAGKDATGWFREGIRASIEQYQNWAEKMYVVAQVNNTVKNYNPVDEAKINAYLARPEFQTATLEKIISQQWINLYRQPQEMWATWKRTGLPAFKAEPTPEDGVAYLEEIKDADNTLLIPRRNSLPTPNSLNIDNYYSAIEALKTDSDYGKEVSTTEGRIWWDKKK